MRDLLKGLARKSKTAIVIFKIYDNWRLRRRTRSGDIRTIHGSTHLRKSTTESLDYINRQFIDYLTYSGLSQDQVAGKTILELGFGDNLGVALKFIAAGAARVVCLDRFYSEREAKHQTEIYQALREELTNVERERFDQVFKIDREPQILNDRLQCIYGSTLDQVAERLAREHGAFDLIISRAVLEEIWEPDTTFLAMSELLAPHGYLLHKIDLRDYGIFRNFGMHPLTFLMIPDWAYRLMASDSGIPNRRRLSYYRKRMNDLGYNAKLLVTCVLGRGRLEPHKAELEMNVDYSQATLDLISEVRPRLSRSFRALPDEDLLVEGIFLVAQKSGLN